MTSTVKSAERALAVLEYFALVRRPATAAEIQMALQIPQSSTSLLLHCLLELGYLEFSPEQRSYSPSVRVRLLGDWVSPGLPPTLSGEKLDQLRALTNATVLVARQVGWRPQYIRVLFPAEECQSYVQDGARPPLPSGASGRALLSALSDQTVRTIVRRNNAEAKNKAQCVNEDVLLKSIHEIRRTGIAETDPRLSGERNFYAVAVPVLDPVREETFSLCVTGPRPRILRNLSGIRKMLHAWNSPQSMRD